MTTENPEITIGQYADKIKQISNKQLGINAPNGFDSWHKTHCYVVAELVQRGLNVNDNFCELALQLTNDRESENAHTKDNKPYTIKYKGKEYLAREVYDKRINKFYVVAQGALALEMDKYPIEPLTDTIAYFVDENDFQLNDEQICKLMFG